MTDPQPAEKKAIPIYEYWYQQYLQVRYLKALSDEEVKQRFADITRNVTTLAADGAIGCLPPDSEWFLYWMAMGTQVLAELELRTIPLPDVVSVLRHTPLPEAPTWSQVAAHDLAPRFSGVPALFKYGQRDHLQEILHRGVLRISGASSYSDPSLSPGRLDDELKLRVELVPASALRLRIPSKPKGPPDLEVPVLRATRTVKTRTDYYVFCLSEVLDYRLFSDFSANACLMIKDRDIFIRRVLEQFEKSRPGWSGIAGVVRYVDPLLEGHTDIDIHLSKHFRYWYQKEFRFVWLPDQVQSRLGPIVVELGDDLASFCELVTL